MSISSILVATDLDPSTAPLHDYAASLALRLGATLTLLHVDQIGAHAFTRSDEIQHYLTEIRAVLEARMDEAAERVAARGVEVRAVVRQGQPAEEILSVAHAEAVDLIVLAKRKETALDRVVLGSNTRRLLRRSAFPILVFDVAARVPKGLERVMTTTDMSPESEMGIEYARNLASSVDARCDVVHVFQWPLYVPNAPGHPVSALPPQTLTSLESFYDAELVAAEQEAGANDHIVIVDAEIAHGVARWAGEHHVDLIVIPSHGKGAVRATLLGSTSERLIELSTTPVLVLPRAFLKQTAEV